MGTQRYVRLRDRSNPDSELIVGFKTGDDREEVYEVGDMLIEFAQHAATVFDGYAIPSQRNEIPTRRFRVKLVRGVITTVLEQ